MALVYRAIWQDDRDDVCAAAQSEFTKWVESEKSNGALQVPDTGHAWADISRIGKKVHLEVSTERATGDGDVRTAYRAYFTETAADNVRWQTTLRSWETGTVDGGRREAWLWVDLEVVGDVDLQRLSPAAPRLVRNLIESGQRPRLDDVQLSTTPTYHSGAAAGALLAGEVSAFSRQAPIVVFVDDPGRFDVFAGSQYTFADIVNTAARTVAGIATVAVVDQSAATAFNMELGDDHGVRDGAFRIYLKDLDPALKNDSWRHRFVTASRYMGLRGTAAKIIAGKLGALSGVHRPPASFNEAKSLLDALRTNSADDYRELLAIAEDEIGDLRDQLQEKDEDYLGLATDLETIQEERTAAIDLADSYRRQLDHALAQLRELNQPESYWDSEAYQASVPSTASSASEAVRQAQTHLRDRLLIHDRALRDIEDLDATVHGSNWGQRAWDAFRALHAYACDLASDAPPKTFWYWCKDSRHPLAWRASTKALAMSESDTVKKNSKFHQARILPVSEAVDSSGAIYMEAHIKIAAGGGDLSPRIYFYEHRETATIHVGFFGPHKYMPNTRS
ncbi:hypothetical protein A5767_05905 [Rhodococcus sp. 852002-51564_SCH6189132-a]|uniref:hypothetical protein n=1 Tax=Rhodococcus sp. 852002-51564_SCH6189132-a TaxID=1834103 RepID=UPI0007EB898B|nr:hypothetical protein [Rhodococcus sp. 852002-51564_SCH6189132-a]OBA37955.1 hypothetical protein A5767_05905 [Rhodococcus sp. 852002-51564_SCH6189132-a]